MDTERKIGHAARRVGGVAIVPAAALLTVALLALGLHLAGYDAAQALGALWSGSFGTWYALASSTLVRATPLILTGLAVALAFRAGVWNIGAEGQLLVGAAAAAAVALAAPAWSRGLVLPVALAAGAAGGAVWAWIAAVLRQRFDVLEVISTIMLNFVAIYLVGYLVRGPLQEPTHVYPQSDPIPGVARLPVLLPGTRLHVGLLLALSIAPVLWWMLRASAAGFRLRATGENPRAASSAGMIDVGTTTAHAFIVSGAIAGLAGAVELTGVTFALYENISPGYGYTAIAVALLARLDPLGVVATGVLFGALESGALAMQREAAVPAVVASVVEGALILFMLAATRWRLLGALALPGTSERESAAA